MTISEIRAALAELEASPRRSLGQNFLHDQNLAEIIAETVGRANTIVEIGAGLGSLTQHLATRAEHLILVEKDAKMVEWLRKKFAQQRHIEIHHLDALDFDLRTLWGNGTVNIAGNLPYYVSTPLIEHWSSPLCPAERLVFALQSEVAQRFAASPDNKIYGAMSVCVQRRWRVNVVRKLPPKVFYPEPKVDSSVVLLEARRDLPSLDDTLFSTIVRKGFSERRKQLRGLFPEYREHWDALCSHLDIPPTARAENLAVEQWEKWTQFVSPNHTRPSVELFDEVDSADRVVAPRPRGTIHANNLFHRAVHVLIFNASGELFLQRRSPWKDRYPNLWDSSVAGHVDAGETYPEAALRELTEEIGITTTLERIGRLEASAKTGWEFVEIFRGQSEGPFHFDGLEVATGAFFSIPRITDWLAQHPKDFTPLFRRVFQMGSHA